LLSGASLAVLHGGLGGIKESILAGVPMLLVPFVFDQRPNAERIAFHGLGGHGSRKNRWSPPGGGCDVHRQGREEARRERPDDYAWRKPFGTLEAAAAASGHRAAERGVSNRAVNARERREAVDLRIADLLKPTTVVLGRPPDQIDVMTSSRAWTSRMRGRGEWPESSTTSTSRSSRTPRRPQGAGVGCSPEAEASGLRR